MAETMEKLAYFLRTEREDETLSTCCTCDIPQVQQVHNV